LRVPLPFVLVLACGVFGLIAAPRADRGLLPVVAILGAALPVIAFVTSRHRLPMLPPLLVAAAWTIASWSQLPRVIATRRGAVAACVALALTAVAFLPIGSASADRPRMLTIDAVGRLRAGRAVEAVALLEEARRLAPGDATILTDLGAAYQRTGRV